MNTLDGDGDGELESPRALRPRTHARKKKPLGKECTWTDAYWCVREIVDTKFGRPKDVGIWIWYTTHIGADIVTDLACRVHSEWKQGELHDPVLAFHHHLQELHPKENTK